MSTNLLQQSVRNKQILELWWLWSLLERLPRRRWCWLILWLDPAWDPAKLLSCLRVSLMIFSNLEHKNSSRMTMLKMKVSLLLWHLSLVNQNIPDTTLKQGHPVTVFCKISVRRSNNCPEFSIAWGRLKFSRWPFMYNFRSLSNKFPTIFWSLIFPISLPRLSYFFVEKGNLKFSDPRMRCREESEKFSLS